MVDVYVASAIETDYPRKLQKPSTVRTAVRDTAESFIMDSGIGNDELSNSDVLDLAHEHDADFVVAKDYLHDQERTTESVREFIDLYPSHPCDAIPMVPLQPPHHEHYRSLPGHQHYVLGGMVGEEISTRQRIKWIECFDAVARNDCHAHALGVGGGMGIIRAFAGSGILDSVDCSTPEQAATFGKVLDDNLRQVETIAHMGGDGTKKRTTPLAEFNSWQVQDVWDREATVRNNGSGWIQRKTGRDS